MRDVAPDTELHLIDATMPYQAPIASGEESFPAAAEEPGLGDPALIVFTSGTTGQPKGAALNQRNLSHDAQNIVGIWDISERDTFCHALPLYHVHGLCFALHTALIAGAHVLMLDSFSPEKVMEVLSR